MKWIQKASGDNIYIVMATRRALTSANHLVKLTVYSYEYDLILTCVRLRLSSRSMIRKWNFVFSYKWNGRIIRNATQCMSQFDFDCIASLPACLPVRVLNTVRKREAGKGNPKSLISFSQSPVSTRTCFYYIKRNGKKRGEKYGVCWLIHSFIFLFPNRRDAWVSGSRSSRQLTSCSPSGQDDAIGGGGGGSSGLCRVSRRLTDRLFFLPKQNIWKIKIITRQLFAASLRTIAIIYTTRNWSGEEEALFTSIFFPFFFF